MTYLLVFLLLAASIVVMSVIVGAIRWLVRMDAPDGWDRLPETRERAMTAGEVDELLGGE